MANTTRNAILKALLDGAICELLVKTGTDNVYLQDGATTLSAKLAEMIVSLNAKATTAALTEGLAGKSDTGHTHVQADVSGLADALSERPTTSAMNTAISDAISDLINGAPGTYDTLKEIADYISQHEEVVDALNAAIGNKADASTVAAIQVTVNALGALATKSKISESDLDDSLKGKVNAASEASHSHSNKALLDTYTQTEANLADAVSKKHTHSNKSVLDGITSAKVSGWDGKGRFYAAETQPAGLTASDLWVQLI